VHVQSEFRVNSSSKFFGDFPGELWVAREWNGEGRTGRDRIGLIRRAMERRGKDRKGWPPILIGGWSDARKGHWIGWDRSELDRIVFERNEKNWTGLDWFGGML
jgi:hypothetical protein